MAVVNFILGVTFNLIIIFCNIQAQSPLVDIGNEQIIGKIGTVNKGNGVVYTVKEYLGIPFAKPPVGNLRFRKPEAFENLNSNPYNATFFRPYCPHVYGDNPATGTEDEDCLYLNIYATDQAADRADGHAVMIWIYGGGFGGGAADSYIGANLAVTGNVIVVTINYRTAVFGFFTTMDSAAPGNYGLFDQIMAIQWVSDNIGSFGGDKSRVTIFGESAGAMSVCLLGLYAGNYGMFQRVIAESGSASSPYLTLRKDYLRSAKYVANMMGCPVEDTAAITDCLRQIPWQEIKSKYMSFLMNSLDALDTVDFMPMVDGDLIKTDYQNMLQSNPTDLEFFRSLDFLNGVNAFEGATVVPYTVGAQGDVIEFKPSQADMRSYLIDSIRDIGHFEPVSDEIKESILHEYTNWEHPDSFESIRIQYAKMIGNYFFDAPAIDTSRVHSNTGGGSTYVYNFMPIKSQQPPWTPSWIPGADHTAEINLVLGMRYDSMHDWEKILSDRMMIYWSNFAKSGNPNSPVQVDTMWPSYNMSHQLYMELDKDMGAYSSKQFLYAREAHFWLDVMPGFREMTKEQNTDDCSYTGAGEGKVVNAFMLIVSGILSAILRFC